MSATARAPPARPAAAPPACGRAGALRRAARAHPVVAGGRGVALVEDQVDRLEHRCQPLGQLAALGHLDRHPRGGQSVRLARTMRCARSPPAPGTRGRSPGRQPASSRKRKRHPRLHRQHRVTGGEDQAQQVVAERVGDLGGEVGRVRLAAQLQVAPELLGLAPVHVGAAHAVDRAVLGRGHQPGAGVVGDAGLRPLLERRDQRLLREVLGEADVAHEAREARDQPRGLDPPDRIDRALDVGRRHLATRRRPGRAARPRARAAQA